MRKLVVFWVRNFEKFLVFLFTFSVKAPTPSPLKHQYDFFVMELIYISKLSNIDMYIQDHILNVQ